METGEELKFYQEVAKSEGHRFFAIPIEMYPLFKHKQLYKVVTIDRAGNEIEFYRKIAKSSGRLMFYIPTNMHRLFRLNQLYKITASEVKT